MGGVGADEVTSESCEERTQRDQLALGPAMHLAILIRCGRVVWRQELPAGRIFSLSSFFGSAGRFLDFLGQRHSF
jgi:hypothetical protein